MRSTFSRDPSLAENLLATGDCYLAEGLPAKDNFWGIGESGKGRNELGKILMKLRDEIRELRSLERSQPSASAFLERSQDIELSECIWRHLR